MQLDGAIRGGAAIADTRRRDLRAVISQGGEAVALRRADGSTIWRIPPGPGRHAGAGVHEDHRPRR
jgi:uncharacterized protein GlcG (DUF336 family)